MYTRLCSCKNKLFMHLLVETCITQIPQWLKMASDDFKETYLS